MDEDYWTLSRGKACRNGWSCRECKQDIYKGEPMVVRDGRKIRLFYHEHCFSGTADPRTQVHSSFNQGKFTNINPVAPRVKGYGKWAVSSYGYKGG